jgi:hypothetical protein
MAFQSIKRILPGAIREVGLEEQVTSVQVLQTAQTVLLRYWGEERASLVSMRSFAQGVLKLETNVPAAAQELKVMEVRLLNEINRILGAKKVIKLQCLTH